jgi:CheY-like chemotaxis protein
MTLTLNSPAANPEMQRSAPLVLVVGDSPIDRRLAGGIIERQAGVRVVYANDGLAALQLLETQTVALIVTELQMPRMDGLELVETVRGRFPLIPTILMSAHGSEEIALQALRRGAASYVPKRNLEHELAGTVRDVLSLSQTCKQRQRLNHCWTQTKFQFCLENDAALIPLLVVHLQEYLQSVQHCDETELVRVGVALHEALRNAMHHGNLELDSELRRTSPERYYELAERRREQEPFRRRRVHVTARESRAGACYIIRDEGPGFDPAAVPDPTDAHNLDQPGGRGLMLIRTFMDDVRFNSQGNQITLVHRRAVGDRMDKFWPSGDDENGPT